MQVAMLLFSASQRLLTKTENRMSALSSEHAASHSLTFEKGILFPLNRQLTQEQLKKSSSLFLKSCLDCVLVTSSALFTALSVKIPGNKDFGTSTIPKVVGGLSPSCIELGKLLYEKVITKVVPVSSCEAAEMTKLLENVFQVSKHRSCQRTESLVP